MKMTKVASLLASWLLFSIVLVGMPACSEKTTQNSGTSGSETMSPGNFTSGDTAIVIPDSTRRDRDTIRRDSTRR